MNKIDIGIIIFLMYHLIRGYTAGFSRSVILSLRLVVSLILTGYLMANYKMWLLDRALVKAYLEFTSRIGQNFVTPYLYRILEIEQKILWMSVFVLVGFGVTLAAEILLSGMRNASQRNIDRSLGFVFGGLKGLCYLMLAVSLLEPLLQKFASIEMLEWISSSDLLRYLYRYNFFLDIFS